MTTTKAASIAGMLFSVLLIAVLASAHIDSRLILRSHIMFDLRQRLLAEQKA